MIKPSSSPGSVCAWQGDFWRIWPLRPHPHASPRPCTSRLYPRPLSPWPRCPLPTLPAGAVPSSVAHRPGLRAPVVTPPSPPSSLPATVLPPSQRPWPQGAQGAAEGRRPQRAWRRTGVEGAAPEAIRRMGLGSDCLASPLSLVPCGPGKCRGLSKSPSPTCETETAGPAREVRFPAPSKALSIQTWARTHRGGGRGGGRGRNEMRGSG